MKIIILLIIFLSTITSNAQWTQIGQPILGESNANFTGSSVSINNDGDRIALYDAFFNGDSRGRVRVFELQNNNWIPLGNEVIGLLGDGQSLGTVKLNSTGNRFIFGSPLHAANGVNLSGTARIFELQGNNWIQLGDDLVGLHEEDYFGTSVDISDDGDTVIVGAIQLGIPVPNSGYAKVYRFVNGNWLQLGSQINGTNNSDRTGKSVSINSDGSVVAVSAPFNDDNGLDSGKVRIFKFENNSWLQIGNDIFGQNNEDKLGNTTNSNSALSLNFNGNRIAIGASDHVVNGNKVGQVRVFENQNNSWVQLGQSIDGEVPLGLLGVTVSLNDAGNIVVAGAPFGDTNKGRVKVFKILNNSWIQEGETINGETNNSWTGWCVDINNLGNRIIFGSPNSSDNGNGSGKVQIFQNDAVLSIYEQSVLNNISLLPNPNRGNFVLKLPRLYNQVSVKVTDTLGKEVFNKNYFDYP